MARKFETEGGRLFPRRALGQWSLWAGLGWASFRVWWYGLDRAVVGSEYLCGPSCFAQY